ncbi:MAG: metal-dependent transcriptional regulator [Desulfobacterales bacterium]|nr:metal-dependent transcriptional regulator [Desulfobacterales bacterium]
MLREELEEILEAVWVSNEYRKPGLEEIKKNCPVEIADQDLLTLQQEGLIHRQDNDIHLTEAGKVIAAGLVRRHRLAEVLLSSILQLRNSDMEEVACKVEHCLQPEVEESICTLLGHPEVCPDGKPIPRGRCCTKGLTVVDRAVVSLSELKAGERGKITYIKPITHSNFHQLISFGLHPGVVLTVHRNSPTICIKFGNTELALADEIAANIFVWRLHPEDHP